MIESKNHPLIAFFVDAYFLESVIGFFDTYSRAFFGLKKDSPFILISIPIILLCLILYHLKFKTKLAVRTVGELIAGVRFNEGRKVNINPFTISRLILWITMFFSLGDLNRSNIPVDGTAIGNISILFFFIFIFSGYSLINQGKVLGLIILLIPLSIKFARVLVHLIESTSGTETLVFGVYLAIILVTIIVPIAYFSKFRVKV